MSYEDTSLHHFYHIFADGYWQTPLAEHLEALRTGGLLDHLDTFAVGFVGTPENIALAKAAIDADFIVVAESATGWEQETLNPLRDFIQDHDGLVSYAHTKGSANHATINWYWRRSMEYFCYVKWEEPIRKLLDGAKLAGCHWFAAAPAENPEWGTGGMFGGNYWWARCDVLRHAPVPEDWHRFAAEHWVGRLSEVLDISPRFIHDLNPRPIDVASLVTEW